MEERSIPRFPFFHGVGVDLKLGGYCILILYNILFEIIWKCKLLIIFFYSYLFWKIYIYISFLKKTKRSKNLKI